MERVFSLVYMCIESIDSLDLCKLALIWYQDTVITENLIG